MTCFIILPPLTIRCSPRTSALLPLDESTDTTGLHVLRVTSTSPASQTDLELFFDFVVGLKGNPFSPHMDASVESNEDKQLNLLVWSSNTQQTRREPMVRSNQFTFTLTVFEASRFSDSLAGFILSG
jgi:GRASP55/65 PDZ-like domain